MPAVGTRSNVLRNLKFILAGMLFVLFIYFSALWQVGGRSLAGHGLDIWRMPLVRAKVRLIRADLREKFDLGVQEEAPIAAAKRKLKGKAVLEAKDPKKFEVSEDDRDALQKLIAEGDK
jgi:hypothetical protein